MGDFYALYNFNAPASETNQLRQFDIKADTPSINLVRLTLAHKPRRVGFRLDAGLGDTADVYFAEDPAATGRRGRIALTARLEYRHDHSTASVFEAGSHGEHRPDQDTLTVASIAQFQARGGDGQGTIGLGGMSRIGPINCSCGVTAVFAVSASSGGVPGGCSSLRSIFSPRLADAERGG